ncbi:hypothetical protein DDE18_03460 [Nocardioides gansuensis]|uniref:Fibronectin type-III domain-containing protein n=1 Tax=Nocardioides gansuensis TaxID=2138300 RepID=A0A2T8FG42_9ACTN|nr:fibronectin type III domain-containing protein [Nocardioides gansuensis]PVG84669.1 hypothetical protein DDE18_03460 [Nocardioides gansuensis]
MARKQFLRRHRASVASGLALAVMVGAVVVQAVTDDGYRKHQAELNDGGIWVVNDEHAVYGRLNKPINQLDSRVVTDELEGRFDVVQDGAAVVALDEQANTARVVDPATSTFRTNAQISVPGNGDVRLAGGTFAAVDARTGELWAVPVDPQVGQAFITPADRQAEELAKVGTSAALTVTQGGTVVATSAGQGTVTWIARDGADFEKPREEQLPEAAGAPTAVTAVGERAVTYDAESGQLQVVDGPGSQLPADGVLQQAGPDAGTVLVATRGALLSVDLESGVSTVVREGLDGAPAEPVRLGACVYGAWWGGSGAVVIQCGDAPAELRTLGGNASRLAFRVNRGQIVLNDDATGAVWDLEQDKPLRIDNWNAFTSSKKVQDDKKQQQETAFGERKPPKAKPDQYGARPGRTTVLHPLDNDSAQDGHLLSISRVDKPTGGASAEISPDGQTVVLSMPSRASRTSFEYFINDGRDGQAHATISVTPREPGQNESPDLREGFEPRTWRVPAGSALSVPVLADWRDDADGDTLILDTAEAVGGRESGAQARTTSDGRIRFTAPQSGDGPVRVQYTVTDGQSAPVEKSVTFLVQDKLDQKSHAAVAEPDVVRGEVGKPIKIRPLLNDLPGSDPSTPHAELALGGRVQDQSRASVKTDVENGVVTFQATQAGTYFLKYEAAFGNAPLATAQIRVDVSPPRDADPVAMPDATTLYGQAPGVIDVLANDLDPAGGLLVVQRATADDPRQLDVAIIDGRWLRISARQGELQPRTQLVHYQVSNGAKSGIEGEVVVTQRPRPQDDSPVTVTDRVRVRAGTSVTAAVLDNDISPSGDRLSLVTDTAEGTPGELKVVPPGDVKTDPGRAFVWRRTVRYVAPAGLQERDTYEITYIATNSSGVTSPGRLLVTIIPAGAPNTAPEPPTLEARTVSGDRVKVRLPGSGIDQDGDPVTVTGITSAPRLGRILAYGANFLEYEAYPRTAGTDEFTYSVVDSEGAVAEGTARVAVVPPGPVQPPLAVDDRLVVEPGRTGIFDPYANDFVDPGDEVQLDLVDPPEGVTLDDETGLVSVPAPGSKRDPAVTVVYSLSNGIDESRATMTLDVAEDYNNPPVVYDAYGRADDSGSVAVDVLEGAYDPDGSADDLTVEVFEGRQDTSVTGSRMKVTRGESPKVVPFRVTDADGAAASAVVYVPPTGTAIPYVEPDALIRLEPGGTAKGELGDYIVNPSGGSLRLTQSRAAVSTSPSDLDAARDGNGAFEVSAPAGFRGYGAVLLEVTTAIDPAGNEDVEDPKDGYTALLSIPVQVGDDVPVLTCPDAPIPISAGESHDIDIATLCHVWSLDPRDADDLAYQSSWSQELDGLSLSGSGSAVRVSADAAASTGGEAVLSVRAGESNTEEIRFRLAAAPPPSLLPLPRQELDAGESRTLDLARFLQAGVADPQPTVVSATLVSGSGVSASTQGSSVTLRAGGEARGRAVYRVVMSDVADSGPGSNRRAEGTLELIIGGTPSAPGAPFVNPSDEDNALHLSWAPPRDDGGSPITHYIVQENHTDKRRICRTNACAFTGLKANTRYRFRVAAVNKVGTGEWSADSLEAVASSKPDRVRNIRMIGRGDHTVTIGWTKPEGKILEYLITYEGGQLLVPGDRTSWQITGLDNNKKYVFSIKARNEVDYSLAQESPPMQSLGTPAAPGTPTVSDQQSGNNQTSVAVSWPSTLPEGPGPVTYTLMVSEEGGAATPVPGCSKIQATSCTHGGVVYDGDLLAYSVTASNIEKTGPASAPAIFDAVGKPASFGAWSVEPTGADQQLRVTGATPEPRGKQARVAIIIGGQVVRELPMSAGQVINEVVSTPSNESPYTAQLRICNEWASRGACTLSDVRTAQSYGPLNGHLRQPTPTVDGRTVVWTLSGTSNGNAAVLGVSIDGGAEETVRLDGAGAFSLTRSVTVADYNTQTNVRVRLYDDAPAGRGEAQVYATVESGDPPAPNVSFREYIECGDLDVSARPCKQAPFQPECTDNSCGRLLIVTEGFIHNYSCTVSTPDDPLWTATFGRVDLDGGQASYETTWYFKHPQTVTLSCGNGRQSNSFTQTWPG